MTCRRICRELLIAARFGELGPGSTPHLEHLSTCRGCRDELGFDRALVRQLRTALAARVEGAAPSPQAWEGILARMAQPEPRPTRLRAWSTAVVARLRFGSAMAGATLAVVMALNVDVVAVRPSDALTESTAGPSAALPARPPRLADGFPQVTVGVPYAPAATAGGIEARGPIVVGTVPEPEQLPLSGVRGQDAAATGDPADTEPAVQDAAPDDAWQPLTVRLVPADAAVVRGSTPDASAPAPPPEPESTPPVSGAPS